MIRLLKNGQQCKQEIKMIPHILTKTSLVITGLSGQEVTSIDRNNPDFEEIYSIVNEQDISEHLLKRLIRLTSPGTRLKEICSEDKTVQMTITEHGTLKIIAGDSEYFPPASLAQAIFQVYELKGDLKPLANFVAKLANNPRKEVADELWDFINVCGLTLTEDGNFLAYKNVNSDFTSIYDSKTDNTPGTVLSMRRQDVEHNPDKTCSAGLHFAAWGYLSHYSSGGKTVLLSISPEDVVSIPSDYNNMKGRAWRYKVLREVKQPEELKNYALYND